MSDAGGKPLVSVVTVNYNGAELLGKLLDSLRGQTYQPREILVVDNGSTDGSVELVQQGYPEVRLIRLDTNSGFTGGNNAGILAARGDLIALINNDAEPDRSWLEELVRTADPDPEVAAVASKILFFRPYLPVHFTAGPWWGPEPRVGEEAAEVEAVVDKSSAFEDCSYRKSVFKDGFVPTESREGRRLYGMRRQATLFLPVGDTGRGTRLRLLVASADGRREARLHVAIGATRVATLDLTPELRERWIEVPSEIVAAEAFDLINNAGTQLSSAGEAADRGIYEPDRGQYDRPEDVEAFCGAATLLRRSALERVGLFDRDFFMYYEDTDLSWRLRSRGFRIRYQPRSRVRHLHAASSVEWSPTFTFFTARNKILMIAKNAAPWALLRACAAELRSVAGLLRQVCRRPLGPVAARARRELATRLRVHGSLLEQLPRALLKRVGLLAP